MPDEQTYKTQFDQNFQQSCYAGFEHSFTEQQISPTAEDLQAARINALIRMGEEFAGLYGQPDTHRDTLALTFGNRLEAHALS